LSDQTELSRRVADVLGSAEYASEDLILSLTGDFLERMELTGTTRTELADRLGVKPPRVTRILQGNDNFTLRTVSQVAEALGCRLVFALEPCDASTPPSPASRGTSTALPVARNAPETEGRRGEQHTAAVGMRR